MYKHQFQVLSSIVYISNVYFESVHLFTFYFLSFSSCLCKWFVQFQGNVKALVLCTEQYSVYLKYLFGRTNKFYMLTHQSCRCFICYPTCNSDNYFSLIFCYFLNKLSVVMEMFKLILIQIQATFTTNCCFSPFPYCPLAATVIGNKGSTRFQATTVNGSAHLQKRLVKTYVIVHGILKICLDLIYRKEQQDIYSCILNLSFFLQILSKLITHFSKVDSRQCTDETELAEHVVGLTCSLASCQFGYPLAQTRVHLHTPRHACILYF